MKMKKTYIRPTTAALAFCSESILCTSPTGISVDGNRETEEIFVREQLPESGSVWGE